MYLYRICTKVAVEYAYVREPKETRWNTVGAQFQPIVLAFVGHWNDGGFGSGGTFDRFRRLKFTGPDRRKETAVAVPNHDITKAVACVRARDGNPLMMDVLFSLLITSKLQI